MPRLSVWMIRTSLLHMGTGFLFGALMLFNKGFPLHPAIWRLLNPHIEIMIFGWMIQLVMGVAFMILPRFPDRHKRYGREGLAWWSYYTLNTGVIVSAVADWYAIPWLAFTGRVSILLAMIAFAIMIFPRVKPMAIVVPD